MIKTGYVNNPRVTTLAPTIPVLAANNAPTITTDIAKPLSVLLNKAFISFIKLSAIFVFSKIKPIKMKSGTAKRF